MTLRLLARPKGMMRVWAASFAVLLALLGAPGARADSPPIRVPSDVFEGVLEAVLPPPPSGSVVVVRGPVEYVVPAHYEDDVDGLDRTRRRATELIGQDLGVFTDERVRVRIGRNEDEMRAMAPVGMPPPSYASGVAYPSLGLVLLTLTTRNPGEPVPDVHRVLTHELSHVALHRAAGGGSVPRWFSEGMAVYHANENGLERIQTLWQAASQEKLLPIVRLSSGFADGSPDVDVAYAQSTDIVGYLLRLHHGQDKMRRLLGKLREGSPFEAALEHAFFTNLRDLDTAWRTDLGERHSSYPLIVGGGGLWAAFFVVLAFGWYRKRGRSQKKLEQWANEDAALASLEAELERKLHAADSKRALSPAAPRSHATPSEPSGPRDTINRGGDTRTLH